jgi:UDP-N-acetylmuramate dehydrogenase
MRKALERLARLDIGGIRFDAPLREQGWWKIGGPADLLVEPGTIDQVQNLVKALRQFELPYVVIGDGSNILFDDAGLRGVVVKIGRRMSGSTIEGQTVMAEAGIFVPWLIRSLGRAGLSGLEHAIGVPGTLGGLILMNGGSRQQGIGSHVEGVWAVGKAGELKEYDQSACCFTYRGSSLQHSGEIVVRAKLRLSAGNPGTICREMLAIMRLRRSKFPLKQPNCGSVFLSDPAMYETVGPPGKVIEDCGFKGLRIGDAMIPHLHANFIVNLGQARSADVLAIIRRVRKGVLERTGFELLCEVRYLSTKGQLLPAHKAPCL